ncbi:MAG: glucosaminidase domain-containing protein [Akkermansia sp.]|nr:glucosaminidase domain-containing protein [Akkermansia sp.]
MRYFLTILTLCFAMLGTSFADTVTDLRPVINEAAAANGVDPVLVEAIIRYESAHATSHAAVKKNNLAGIMGRRGQRRYESKEDCVRDLARILGEYKAKGRVTVAQIGRIYCTSGDPWARSVSANMNSIRNGKWGALEANEQSDKKEG